MHQCQIVKTFVTPKQKQELTETVTNKAKPNSQYTNTFLSIYLTKKHTKRQQS